MEPKSVDPTRQSKQLESMPSKNKKNWQIQGDDKLPTWKQDKLLTHPSIRTQTSKHLSRTGIQKSDKNALLYLLPPTSETNQNKHERININPIKHRQRLKLNLFSNILPQAQIVIFLQSLKIVKTPFINGRRTLVAKITTLVKTTSAIVSSKKSLE